MIEQEGRVIAVEADAVWVETLRRGACASCSARAGCGQGLMNSLGVSERRGQVRALTDLHLNVGDAVAIGVPERALLAASIQAYLLPLLGLFAIALLADRLGAGEPWVILCGLAGLFGTWIYIRWRSLRTADDPAWQPVVLRACLTVHRPDFVALGKGE
ncbi:MAG TPA: SoxR reducing system RseC family protein [Pseudomonas sp.]|uniref:SoxR reducing system RseC family protein n=1 Tax=Pseudomonas sp. TaxID=306 RepID=UPI002CE60E64|nr:SoxR reducing system RseC family protein [Pseudomonas sp.]HTO19445.1 SoxR reducing system RseC family protein [Pseudomonas sp.]